ncbi:MAG: type I polyketide synthase, partial [Planctomycetaceae bacterium]|nr:type I polyketide synthase [Planctomycetaceae bacterium]
AVGDPAETEAIGRVFGPHRTDEEPMIIGSCKTNLGHLEAASGVASIAKVLQMLKHKRIPPNLHFSTPNPHIPFESHRLRVPTKLEPWPDDRPAIIGINSFGFGGANAHIILGECCPEPAPTNGRVTIPSEAAATKTATDNKANDRHNGNGHVTTTKTEAISHELPLVLSARSPQALRELAERFQHFLATAQTSQTSLSDIAYSLANRRTHYTHRLGLVGASFEEVQELLDAFLSDESRPQMHLGESSKTDKVLAFVFCGQGPQRFQMGRELLQREPVFRDVMEDIDRLLKPITQWSLLEELDRPEDESRMSLTSIAQPALFAIHVALARLWQSWGVEPSVVVGHSVGEIAAAHVAGFLSLEEAVSIIGHRGLCLQEDALPGRMMAVALTEDEAQEIVKDFAPAACVAAVNSPQMVTLAGEAEVIEQLGKKLTDREIWWRPLKVQHAFHSHLVEPARESFLDRIGSIENREPICEMISTVTGKPVGAGDLT